MQALILATGESHKLRPLTDQIPSPLIPITNQPVMQYGVELLARAGIKDIVVALHHLGGSVEAYFGEGRRWGVNLRYLLQRDALGDGGSLRWAKSMLTEQVLVLPADQIIDLDIEQLIAFHQERRPLITAVVHEQGPSERKINLNGAFGHRGFHTGCFICEPALIEKIPARATVSIFDDLMPTLQAQNQKIAVFKHDGYWNPLVSFQDFNQATKMFFDSAVATDRSEMARDLDPARLRFPSIPAQHIGNQVWVGRSNAIHPSVKIIPPIIIGDNCQIGREVELGPYTVIGSNVVIDDEATIAESTVNNYTYIGQLVQITNRFIDKNMMVDLNSAESTKIVDAFLLGEATPSLINADVRRVFDVIVASLSLVVLGPILLLVAILTWVMTGGVIETAMRYGVPPGALARGTYKTPQRIMLHRFKTTNRSGEQKRFGRFMRQWKLHRLPEIFDVLAGRTGLVGVKALREDEMEQIREEWQNKRFEYNVGVTGLWFMQLDPDAPLDDILITDAYYVATRSWRSDLKLLLQTPFHWWRRSRQ